MENQYFSLINTVVGSLLGLLVGFVTSWYQFRFEERRDAKLFERTKRAKFRDTEISNCIDLKENLRLWMRAWIAIVDFDSKSLRESGNLQRIPENLNEEYFELSISINALVANILDEDVRLTVERLKSRSAEIMTQVIFAKTAQEKLGINDKAFVELTELAKRAGERIDSYQRKLIRD